VTDQRAQPPRLPGELIVRLVEAYGRRNQRLPMLHADDVLPLLHGGDREFAAASALLEAERVFYPEGGQG
jgi:hypothetical protein